MINTKEGRNEGKGQQRRGTNGIFKPVYISVYVKYKLNDSPIKRWKLSECPKSKTQWYIVYNRKTFNIRTHKNRRMEICGDSQLNAIRNESVK